MHYLYCHFYDVTFIEQSFFTGIYLSWLLRYTVYQFTIQYKSKDSLFKINKKIPVTINIKTKLIFKYAYLIKKFNSKLTIVYSKGPNSKNVNRNYEIPCISCLQYFTMQIMHSEN